MAVAVAVVVVVVAVVLVMVMVVVAVVVVVVGGGGGIAHFFACFVCCCWFVFVSSVLRGFCKLWPYSAVAGVCVGPRTGLVTELVNRGTSQCLWQSVLLFLLHSSFVGMPTTSQWVAGTAFL